MSQRLSPGKHIKWMLHTRSKLLKVELTDVGQQNESFLTILKHVSQCKIFRGQTPVKNLCLGLNRHRNAGRSCHGNKAIPTFVNDQKTIPCVYKVCQKTRLLGGRIVFFRIFWTENGWQGRKWVCLSPITLNGNNRFYYRNFRIILPSFTVCVSPLTSPFQEPTQSSGMQPTSKCRLCQTTSFAKMGELLVRQCITT